MKASEMSEEQIARFFKRRGFEDDEVAALWPTDFDKRAAVDDILKLRDSEDAEDTFGWDSDDTTKLTIDQTVELKQAKKFKEEKLKRLEEIRLKKKDTGLESSIEQAGNIVSKEEVKASMKDIQKLLSELD